MPHAGQLVRTLVELADTLVDDFDVVEQLTLVTGRCVEVLDVAAAGVMLVAPGGELRVVASSSEAMRVVELFELQAREGPCPDCYRTGKPVLHADLSRIGGRWPSFGGAIRTRHGEGLLSPPQLRRNHNLRLADVARAVVDGTLPVKVLDPPPPSP